MMSILPVSEGVSAWVPATPILSPEGADIVLVLRLENFKCFLFV
ncbi:hypothetical protein [Bradyrhizobium semiaridum]|nr:hypothetical protein [Bradyrhizobium semiaridum]